MDAPLVGQRPDQVHGILDQLGGQYRLGRQAKLAGFDAGDVEHLVNQVQ